MMLRIHGLILVAILSTLALRVGAEDYTPAKCTSALAYEGGPLFAGQVALPAADFAFGSSFDDARRQLFDQAMTLAMTHTKAKAMSAAVATTAGTWHATRAADGSSVPQVLYWASVGKAFTATVIMQLVEEGKLSLTDPVSRWLPDVPNASLITIDHLLQHTAGLFSANEDLVVRKKPGYRTPKEEIAIAARHGAMFCPGQRWRYSNTGYTILGQIIEQIEKRPYHEAVNERIGGRLQLASLRALAPREKADVAPLAPTADAQAVMAPDWGYAAGSVIGSAEDMVRFWHALLTRKLLNEKNTAALFERLYPMFDPGTFYGRGVMLYALPDGTESTKTWLGHSGGTPGAKAVVAFSPGDQAFVAVALTGDGSAEATANLLLKQLHVQQ